MIGRRSCSSCSLGLINDPLIQREVISSASHLQRNDRNSPRRIRLIEYLVNQVVNDPRCNYG